MNPGSTIVGFVPKLGTSELLVSLLTPINRGSPKQDTYLVSLPEFHAFRVWTMWQAKVGIDVGHF